MKLAKALKEKNRIAGEINRLKTLISRENSRDVKSSSTVDVASLWINLLNTTEKLIKVKTEIFKANVGIYDKIVRMAELKGRSSWLFTINTNNEKIENPYGTNIMVTEYKACMALNQNVNILDLVRQFKLEDVDRMTKDLQDEIAKLQDEIDEYNATVSIDEL